MSERPPHHSFPPPNEVVDDQGDDDDALMAAVCEGDQGAFAMLVRRYGARLNKYTATITHSPRLGMEIANETWLGVWAHRERYPGGGQFIPFLLTIAKKRAGVIAKRPPDGSAPQEKAVEVDIEAQLATILPRLDDPAAQRIAEAEAEMGPVPSVRGRRVAERRWRLLAVIGGVVVLVVAIVFVLRAVISGGSGAGTIAKDVKVTVSTTPGPKPLADGTKLNPKTELSASYTSTFARRAYVLVFVVDAAKEIHWIAPAFNDPTQDPSAIEVERTDNAETTSLRSGVVFEHMAEGKLTVFAVVTESITRVSDIERIPTTERTPERLKARFANGSVREWKAVFARK